MLNGAPAGRELVVDLNTCPCLETEVKLSARNYATHRRLVHFRSV
jgi:hypothetical protein